MAFKYKSISYTNQVFLHGWYNWSKLHYFFILCYVMLYREETRHIRLENRIFDPNSRPIFGRHTCFIRFVFSVREHAQNRARYSSRSSLEHREERRKIEKRYCADEVASGRRGSWSTARIPPTRRRPSTRRKADALPSNRYTDLSCGEKLRISVPLDVRREFECEILGHYYF